jgi:acyl-CoA dehydrogenase
MDFELSEELKMIQSLAKDFVDEQLVPLERELLGRAADLSDARLNLPAPKEAELMKMSREMGLWGAGIPEEFGGVGLSLLGTCLVEEELARTIVPFNFGDVTPILFDAGPEQREEYLIPSLNNIIKPYLALMESGGSLDLPVMRTKAGKNDGHYILNGEKISFSRVGENYFAIVFAAAEKGTTCFFVDKGTPGFSVTGVAKQPGWLANIREPAVLNFNDCKVPVENILGEEGGAFKLGRKWLPGRRIVRGARSVGIARRLLDEATAQSQTGEAFGKPIQNRKDIKAALADIAVNIHAARLMVYEAACKADNGSPIESEASMVKLYTTQMVRTVVDRVTHIFNGPSYIEGIDPGILCRHALETGLADLVLSRQRNIIAGDVLKGLKV